MFLCTYRLCVTALIQGPIINNTNMELKINITFTKDKITFKLQHKQVHFVAYVLKRTKNYYNHLTKIS